MRFGNCYLYSWRCCRRGHGCVIVRRSLKSWTPHSQWSPFGVPAGAIELPGFWRGLWVVMGARRGYLVLHAGRAFWVARIDGIYIREYLPPKWVDDSIKGNWWCRTFPLHAVIFSGRVRSGFGEEMRTRVLIRRHWPPVDLNHEQMNPQPKEQSR